MSKADIFNMYRYLKDKRPSDYNSKVPAHFKNALGNSTNEARTPIYNPKRTRKPVYLNINSSNGGIKFPNFPELGTSVKLTTDDIIWTDDLFDFNTQPTSTLIKSGAYKGIFFWKNSFILTEVVNEPSKPFRTEIYKTDINFKTYTKLITIPSYSNMSTLNPDTDKLTVYNLDFYSARDSVKYTVDLNKLTITEDRISRRQSYAIFHSPTGIVSYTEEDTSFMELESTIKRDHYVYNYSPPKNQSTWYRGNFRCGETLSGTGDISWYASFKFYYHALTLQSHHSDIIVYHKGEKKTTIQIPSSIVDYYFYAYNDILFLTTRGGIYKINFKLKSKYLNINKPKIVVGNDPTIYNMVKNLMPGLIFPFKSIGIVKNGKFLIDPHTMYYTYRDTWQYLN